MNATAELDLLLNHLVDDLLDDEGTARLHALLTADAGARRHYRRFIALHAGLRWDYVTAARDQTVPAPSFPRRRWLPLAGMIAATLMAAVILWSLRGNGPILTATEIAGGSLVWSGGANERRTLTAGEALDAGQFVLEGDSASATLRFADGSTLSLTGDSELAVSDDGQKRLHLTRGVLTADVRPHPARRPLLVRTSTAQLVVVGTRFTVTTTTARTALDVEHGHVRLERLADGQSVEVVAQQSAVASLDVSQALGRSTRAHPPDTWTLDITNPPPTHWRGTWVPPAAAAPAFLRAVPYVAGRTAQGAPIIHHGVNIRSLDCDNFPFVRFVAGSRLSLRFRVARPDGRAPVDVMVCTHTGSGSFGGTFTAAIKTDQHPADADGWRTAHLRVEDFLPTRPSQPSLIGREAVFILPRSTSAQTGLEVAMITVESP